MADASFYAGAADPQDLPRAVLISAIACELKVKAVLRSRAHDEALPLLEWLLKVPRDHSVAAIALFDRAMEAVVGRSLRVEDRPLYNGVVRLFELRNGIAHRGELPDEGEARKAVEDAGSTIRWLRQVEASAGPSR